MVACVEVTHVKVTEPGLVNVPLLWFNFILGLNLIFACFKLIIILDLAQKQKKKI